MKETKRPGQQLKGLSVQELLGVTNEESAMEIELRLIHPFKDHPFKVVDDDKMQDLVDSIKMNGVLSPVLLREAERGHYEMISGHRRMHAAELVGLETIPAIIRELSDDEATIMMVDSNIQREELLPSEKGFALKMKMDAMRHQGTSRHGGEKLSDQADRITAAIVGEGSGMAARSVQRYIRLTELIPEILDMVDTKRITFVQYVENGCVYFTEAALQEYVARCTHRAKPLENNATYRKPRK